MESFLSASQKFGAGVVAIPALPIMVNEAGSLCDCSMEFVTGFQRQLATRTAQTQCCTVCGTYYIQPQVKLRQKYLWTSLTCSLFNARYFGRKILLLGNSILNSRAASPVEERN